MASIKLDLRDDALLDIVEPGTELEVLESGLQFLEGPVWHPVEQHLRFSDILGNSTYEWTAARGLTLYRANSHMANGNTYDRQGRLLSCHHGSSRVTRMEAGEMRILASHYQGRQLNSPNDIVVKSDGSIYFTDPPYGREAKVGIPRERELEHNGVYRLQPDSGELSLLTTALNRPNGLCFSGDESLLYVNDSPEYTITVFRVVADGSLQDARLFARTEGDEPGVPDGMKVDSVGNLYCCAQGGLHVFRADGRLLGRLLLPMHITNFTWGDADMRSIYITGISTLYRVRTRIAAVPLF